MECICSMLASLANTVVAAMATADALPIQTDMGRWAFDSSNPLAHLQQRTVGSSSSVSSNTSILGNSQTAAIAILLIVALFGVLTSGISHRSGIGARNNGSGSSVAKKSTSTFLPQHNRDQDEEGVH